MLLLFFINIVVLFSFYRCIDLRSLKGKSRTRALLECSSVASGSVLYVKLVCFSKNVIRLWCLDAVGQC